MLDAWNRAATVIQMLPTPMLCVPQDRLVTAAGDSHLDSGLWNSGEM